MERTLVSWRRLREAWKSILEAARALDNWERMALAESKLEECHVQIARLEAQLDSR